MSAEEPIGVMKCWECVEKHSRDLEHHYEDIIRVEKDPEKRLKYEEAIDYIRKLRKEAHEKAKDIAIEEIKPPKPAKDLTKYWEKTPYEQSEDEVEFSEPFMVEHGEKVWVEHFHTKEECDPRSFRVIKPNPEHILTICCPVGQYSEEAGRCLVGTMAQKLEHLHPEGEGSCPICQGA